MRLLKEDVARIVGQLPDEVVDALKVYGHSKLFLAGGFLRSVITGEKANDIDLFTNTPELAEKIAKELSLDRPVVKTDFAYTIKAPVAIQVIHKFTFKNPLDCIASFDFTMSQAAVYYEGDEEVGIFTVTAQHEGFSSICHDRFYPDLAARRLIWASPTCANIAGGSLLRLNKFIARGYRAPLKTTAAAIARLAVETKITEQPEAEVYKIILRNLVSIDPTLAETLGQLE